MKLLAQAGIRYGGWLPNFAVPAVFSRYRFTLHIPRRPYATALPGIPTIRPFEALACGIPLLSAPWDDAEGLFSPGKDFLFARNGAAMQKRMQGLLDNPLKAARLAPWPANHSEPPYLQPQGRGTARDLPGTGDGRRPTDLGGAGVCIVWPKGLSHRLFRFKSGVILLERRCHLLPRFDPCTASPGHRVTFYEPDAYERQQHRDLDNPHWAKVVVYPATEDAVTRCLEAARGADLVVKASGVGVFDELWKRKSRS